MEPGKEVNSLKFGSRLIEYRIIYSGRKTLGIIVKPDKSVVIRAPKNANPEKVAKILRKKAPWIIRSIEYFEVLLPLPDLKNYISGESYYYLGKHYTLKVQNSKLEDVRLIKNRITVLTKHKTNSRIVKTYLNFWYKNKAIKKFKERLNECFVSFKNYYPSPPKLNVRIMKTRWGSCNTKNKILLNQELIKTPTRCIDYVIMHELCHLIFRNHDHQFYTLLSKLMPDWKERKKALEKSIYKL